MNIIFSSIHLQNGPLRLKPVRRNLRLRRMPFTPGSMGSQQQRYLIRRIKRSTNQNENPFTSHYLPFDEIYPARSYETRYKGTDKKKNRPKSKSIKPKNSEVVSDTEVDDLADDRFFLHQVRRDKRLRNHTLKKDVEVFDINQMRKFGESAEDRTTTTLRPIPIDTDGDDDTSEEGITNNSTLLSSEEDEVEEKNYELIQNSKKLSKNAKFKTDRIERTTGRNTRRKQTKKCYECEKTDLSEEVDDIDDSIESDKEHYKGIDSYDSRKSARRG